MNRAQGSLSISISSFTLNGRTCEMDKIMDIASRYKLFVVEDAAQALGSRFKGVHAGTFGDVSAISFFPAKVLGCFGEIHYSYHLLNSHCCTIPS